MRFCWMRRGVDFPLIKCTKWKSTRSQEHGCQAHRWQYAQISFSLPFMARMAATFTKQLPERIHHSTGCSMWYSFRHCTPEGRRKHRSDDTSGDCKWNVQSSYWKPRIVESLHKYTSKPRAIPWPLFQKNCMAKLISMIISVFCMHKCSAQAPNPTHHLKTF